MKTPTLSHKITLAAVMAFTAVSATPAAVVVDGTTFNTITNSSTTGRMQVTGGSTLQAYGNAGTATNDTQSVYTQFSSYTLGVGQSLRIEMTMTNLNFVSSASGFRLSLSNMPLSSGDVTYANPNWASGTRQGYNLWIPVASPASSADIREFYDLQNPLAGSGSTNVSLGTTSNVSIANGSGSTTIVFEITRNTLTSVQLSGSVGSTVLNTVTDSTSPYFTFNTFQFGLRGYNDGLGFTVDNINVVPEPGTVALFGFGLAVCLARFARRRR